MNSNTNQEEIRKAALAAAAKVYSGRDGYVAASNVVEMAKVFEQYLLGMR